MNRIFSNIKNNCSSNINTNEKEMNIRGSRGIEVLMVAFFIAIKIKEYIRDTNKNTYKKER